MTLYRLKGTKNGKNVEIYMNEKTGKIAYNKATKLGIHVIYISPTKTSMNIILKKVNEL